MGNIHFPRQGKAKQGKSTQVKASQAKASQSKASQGKDHLELVRVSNDPSRTHWHWHPHPHGVSSLNLKSQISNAPGDSGQNQETEPRTKKRPCTRAPFPTPFPTPSNHTYQLSRNSRKPRKNLENLSKKPSKLETLAHLRVTILPAAWHVPMSAARAAQSGSSVPANVALSLMLQICVCVCMCSIVFFSRAHWGVSVSKDQ